MRSAGFFDRQRIACDAVLAPNRRMIAVIKSNFESAVILQRPNRSERIRPRADEGTLRFFLEPSAAGEKHSHDQRANQRNLFHDPMLSITSGVFK